jgi:hypothetical protein
MGLRRFVSRFVLKYGTQYTATVESDVGPRGQSSTVPGKQRMRGGSEKDR